MKIKIPKLFRRATRGRKMRKHLSQPSLDTTDLPPLRTLSGGRTKSYTTCNQVLIMPAPLDHATPPLNLLPTTLLGPDTQQHPRVHRRCSISTRCQSFVRKITHPRALPNPPTTREHSLAPGVRRSLPQLYQPEIDRICVYI